MFISRLNPVKSVIELIVIILTAYIYWVCFYNTLYTVPYDP